VGGGWGGGGGGGGGGGWGGGGGGGGGGGAPAAVGGGGGGARAVIVAPEDLPAFTKLRTGRVLHRQAVALPDEDQEEEDEEEEEGAAGPSRGGVGGHSLSRGFAAVRLALEVAFEGIEGSGRLAVRSSRSRSRSVEPQKEGQEQDGGKGKGEQRGQAGDEQEEEEEAVTVGGVVTVRHRPANPEQGHGRHVVIEWEGGALGDLVADAVVAVVLQAAGEPRAAARADAARRAALGRGDRAAARDAEADLVAALLRAQFGRVTRVRRGGDGSSEEEADANEEEDEGDDGEPSRRGGASYLLRVDVDGDLVTVAPRRGARARAASEAFRVSCDANPALRTRVEKALERMAEAMRPATVG